MKRNVPNMCLVGLLTANAQWSIIKLRLSHFVFRSQHQLQLSWSMDGNQAFPFNGTIPGINFY
ncbi:hypothetical protein, partial [Nitrosococcus oceani]|uniref:hypothetical protein n=1 Tax=Nitrosococcus oceani TaxID=1229 RepID=UPI001A7E97F5